jgi:YD repeat-containing protein
MWFGNSHAETINYIYDELNRLKRVEYGDGSAIEYTYDSAGNRATSVCIRIAVVSPNGGESWRKGSTQTISWIYTGNPGSYVKIELLKGGAVNLVIASSTSIGGGGSGSYNWGIPANQTQGSDYKIRVTSTSNGFYTDTSDNNFPITN